MGLLSNFNQTNLIGVLIILELMVIGNVRTQTIDKTDEIANMEIKTPVIPEPESVKKELKVTVTQETDEAVSTLPPEKIVIGEKSVTETKGKDEEVVNTESDQKKIEIAHQKGTENTNILKSITATKSSPVPPAHNIQHEEEESIFNENEDISDSITNGFYFFLALSSGAVIFILFKIYRLRLTRAERKYGVQGDRANQELTPLPISIEDGHSDDEDQTLFEVQRQNLRIL